jgi:hypothetical protein
MKFKFGVHIRAGDKLSNEKRLNQISRHEIKGFIHEFVPNLLSSIPKDEIPNIYIASESQESYEELKKNLDGCRVFPADRDWRQHGCRATNGQAVLEDIFYLAACNRIYTTLGGGVPLTAYYVSSQQVRVTKYINTFSFRSIYCIFSSVLRRLKRMVN